jgi:hypothetical protein
MTDEDRSESASPGDQPGSDVVLPEHASAYFSPRPPPALTQHRTIETEAVQFDPAIDPDLAETRRMQARSSEPPTWPDVEGPVANAPTVLVPVVRARRTRRRLVAGLVAALLGGAGGVIFGLLDDPASVAPSKAEAPAVAPAVVAAQPASEPAAVTSPLPPAGKGETPVVESPAPIGPTEGRRHEITTSSATGTPTGPKATPKTSAWIKVEPPRAWIQ